MGEKERVSLAEGDIPSIADPHGALKERRGWLLLISCSAAVITQVLRRRSQT